MRVYLCLSELGFIPIRVPLGHSSVMAWTILIRVPLGHSSIMAWTLAPRFEDALSCFRCNTMV